MVERREDDVLHLHPDLEKQRRSLYLNMSRRLAANKDPLGQRALFDWFKVLEADSNRTNLIADRQAARLGGWDVGGATSAALQRAEKRLLVVQRRLERNVSARKIRSKNPEGDPYIRTYRYLTEGFYPSVYAAEDAVMRGHGMHYVLTEADIAASAKENIIGRIVVADKNTLKLKGKRRSGMFPRRNIIFQRS